MLANWVNSSSFLIIINGMDRCQSERTCCAACEPDQARHVINIQLGHETISSHSMQIFLLFYGMSTDNFTYNHTPAWLLTVWMDLNDVLAQSTTHAKRHTLPNAQAIFGCSISVLFFCCCCCCVCSISVTKAKHKHINIQHYVPSFPSMQNCENVCLHLVNSPNTRHAYLQLIKMSK